MTIGQHFKVNFVEIGFETRLFIRHFDASLDGSIIIFILRNKWRTCPYKITRKILLVDETRLILACVMLAFQVFGLGYIVLAIIQA